MSMKVNGGVLVLSDDFVDDVKDFTSANSALYDRALAYEILADNAQANSKDGDYIGFLQEACDAWRHIAESREKQELSHYFSDFLKGVATNSSEPAGDRALSAGLLAHYYETIGHSEHASYYWKLTAEVFMLISGINK